MVKLVPNQRLCRHPNETYGFTSLAVFIDERFGCVYRASASTSKSEPKAIAAEEGLSFDAAIAEIRDTVHEPNRIPN